MSDLIVERSGGVVFATLNRPERKNALTYALFDELGALFDVVGSSPDDRALVLRGAGDDFCSGIDLVDAQRIGSSAEGAAGMDRLNATMLRLHELEKPTVAAVGGLAVGAGMSLALGCDLVVASSRARFSAIFVRRGLSIDCGLSWILPRLVGAAKARELCLLGEFVGADEALALGLVARVVAPVELDVACHSLAERLAQGPTVALGNDLSLLDAAYGRTFREALDAEAAAQANSIATRDATEAIAAFLEKRDARFEGR
jgi:enoyl-CoA hydratase/carnithine racemase